MHFVWNLFHLVRGIDRTEEMKIDKKKQTNNNKNNKTTRYIHQQILSSITDTLISFSG